MSDDARVKTVIQRRPILAFVGWTGIALVAPLVPRMLVDPDGVLAIAPDLAIGMVLVWAVGFLPGAKGLQTLLAVAFGLGGAVLVTFEGIRAIGRAATGEDLLLYDALMLLRSSLGAAEIEWGSTVTPAFAALAMFLVAVFYAGAMALAARWLHEVRWQGPWRSMGLLALVATSLFLAFPDSRPVIPPLRDNVAASLAEWRRMDAALDPEARYGPPDVVLAHPPEVRVVVVRGHTEALRLGPERRRVGALLRGVGRRLRDAGWSVATGRTTPPGQGPRGLPEIELLTGVAVPRTPHLAHVMFEAPELDSLPRFFERHGYHPAVLEAPTARPSLRAFGFRDPFPPQDGLPVTAGERLADARIRIEQLGRPSFVWVRPGHALPEDPVEGLREELDALYGPIAGGPDRQILFLWVGEPATGDDPESAWPLVHVVASNPQMLQPWIEDAGFRRGTSPGRTALPHEALGEHLATMIQRGYACGRACAERRRAQLDL